MLDILDKKYGVDKNVSLCRFWHMFVGDALIGNPDRHLGNWGFIKNKEDLKLAPIYDCGSSLSPLIEENELSNILSSFTEMKNISYNVSSAFKKNNKRIFYYEIFKNPPKELKDAIMRIVPKIDMDKIKNIIDGIESLSDAQKEFYYNNILIRKEQIIDKSYKAILNDARK